jgi:outer membrane protein TolC
VTFAQYWVASRSIAVLEDLHNVLDGVVAAARTRYSQGRGTQAEVLRAEAALTKHQTEIARFVAQKNAARGVLNALILRDPGAALAAPTQLRPLPEAAALRPADLIARAQDASPALAAENGRIKAAGSTLQLAHKGWYPDVTLSAGAIDRGGNGPNGYVASIGIRVPLQWGLHEAEERKATADRDATRARREATGQDVARSIAEATAMLAGARESERLIRTQLLPQDDAVVRSTVVSYGNGRIDLASVLDAARELAEANLSLLATRLDEQRQLAAIERLIGGPL